VAIYDFSYFITIKLPINFYSANIKYPKA